MSVTLYLAYCGWEKTEPLQAFGPLERKNHVFHFVLSGKGRFRAAGKEWELTKGDIFYIPPGVSNEYIADENDPWEYVWVGYGGIWAEEFSEAAGFSNDAFVRRTDRSEEISRLILGMLGARSLSMSDALHRESCLLEVFSLLIREQGSGDSVIQSEDPDFVQQALDYITQHFDKNIRISSLASHLGVSRSYLSSSFKKAIGCSPQNYILNLRMERANSLLRNTTLPVNNVSCLVGYEDQLAFSKIFKQYYGISPSEFRKNGQEIRVYNKKGDFDNSDL
ncbi:MAG: AraC family transcriptional regulator [Lachnospiraceae bacterium]|nr:AraC family transcriptional regulator [Lachnospiraceae bacterium]